MYEIEGGAGIFLFAVSAIFRIGVSASVPQNFVFFVLVSVALCGLFSFALAAAFWQK